MNLHGFVFRFLSLMAFVFGISTAQEMVLSSPASSSLDGANAEVQVVSTLGGSFSNFIASDAGSISSGFFWLSQDEGPVELLVILKPVKGNLSSLMNTGEAIQVLSLAGRRILTLPAFTSVSHLEQELNRIQFSLIVLQSGSGDRKVRMVYSPRR